ncbi:MAG TPA: hypothetical protein PK743_04500 [Luteimonas sp.]|nr:hypothetical protein [Luteimonas sp.]
MVGKSMRWAVLGMALAVANAGAIEVQNLDGFEQYFGRYAPGGDCAKQPQVVIDREGFAFTGGPELPKATQPEYAASYMGNFYEGIGLWFFPYRSEPRPYVLTLNADETPGKLTLEVYDFDYQGGPKLPDRYRPYLSASPYLKCR